MSGLRGSLAIEKVSGHGDPGLSAAGALEDMGSEVPGFVSVEKRDDSIRVVLGGKYPIHE